MQLLATISISKVFGGFWANRNIDIHLDEGEIISLLGENGAGKTTLMNILYGLYQPTKGNVAIKGTPCRISCPKEAIDRGISMVHQHFMLVDSLTAIENIMIGNEPRRGVFLDMELAKSKVEALSRQYGLGIDLRSKVGELSVGEKQRIELLKALYNDCDILILDEPTAVLTPEEVDTFFLTLRKLREAGKGIILISHKLRETMAIADRIYIMRSGTIVAETVPGKTSVEELSELMVGRHLDSSVCRDAVTPSVPLITMCHVGCIENGKTILDEIDLSLRSGSILGIAGIDGNGQTELVELAIGIRRSSHGYIEFLGQDITVSKVRDRIRDGIGYIPEDRNKSGLVGQFTVQENLILGYQSDSRFTKRHVINWKKVQDYARTVISKYDIRCKNEKEHASSLSGGNQQKMIIGRVFEADPQVIIASQPTRGVDIGAIEYIHRQLMEMRNAGKGVLLVSADLDEIMKLSDEIAVMYEGRIVSYAKNGVFSKSQLGSFMAGVCSEVRER